MTGGVHLSLANLIQRGPLQLGRAEAFVGLEVPYCQKDGGPCGSVVDWFQIDLTQIYQSKDLLSTSDIGKVNVGNLSCGEIV